MNLSCVWDVKIINIFFQVLSTQAKTYGSGIQTFTMVKSKREAWRVTLAALRTEKELSAQYAVAQVRQYTVKLALLRTGMKLESADNFFSCALSFSGSQTLRYLPVPNTTFPILPYNQTKSFPLPPLFSIDLKLREGGNLCSTRLFEEKHPRFYPIFAPNYRILIIKIWRNKNLSSMFYSCHKR